MNTVKPFLVLIISAALLYVYVWPQWNAIGLLREREVELQTALGKAQELTQIRNRLVAQYNAISPEDIQKIGRVVPAVYDPVKLVTDVNAIALRWGMIVRDVKFTDVNEVSSTGVIEDVRPKEPYIKRQLSFSTTGQYRNFISFVNELETSLQLMDLQKVEVSVLNQAISSKSGNLDFKVTLYSYWIQ